MFQKVRKLIGGDVGVDRHLRLSWLEFRFRSSQANAATSDANFGIKGALQLIGSGAALNLKFL
jgi:hypothetical protein